MCAFGALLASGAVTLYDFETAEEIAACPVVAESSFSVAVTNAFASSGGNAVRFCCEQWRDGLPQWPSFTIPSPVADWSGYDRFVADVVNCGDANDSLFVYVAEVEGRIQHGLQGTLILPAHGRARMVVPLEKWPDSCDSRKIGRIHFFTERPMGFDVYLDRLTLLRNGEPLPEATSPCVSRDLVPLIEARAEAAGLEAEAARHEACYWHLREKCALAGVAPSAMVVGMAPSMVKIRPRGEFDAEPATNVMVRLARNERESVQILVAPRDADLADVSVTVGDLVANDGTVFSASNVLCSPVGYVNVTGTAPYRVGFAVRDDGAPAGYRRETRTPERGWWPDPILGYLDAVDVKGRDVQGFWVRVTCPESQKAGIYSGAAMVRARGVEPVVVPFSVRVNGFAVPKRSPLPLAITFWPEPDAETPAHAALGAAARNDPDAPINAWRRNRLAWGDFLADYYITMDSLYGRNRLQWDVLVRLKEQGRLGFFNLGYWPYMEEGADTEERWRRDILEPIRANYEKARELGLLDHAYLYGCDELPAADFPKARRAVLELRKEFTGVPIATTAYDDGLGVGTALDCVDWFTPLTRKYDCARAEAARKEGHHVWWYVCCGPHAPYANMYLECPGIEPRMLMGAQAVRMRPDGFLYYQTSIWNSPRCIDGGPFTDWDPASWRDYHGDGSWVCAGPDGTPLPTIRLENFRDGLEDYAYAKILEEKLRVVESSKLKVQSDGGEPPENSSLVTRNSSLADWAQRAQSALAVPREVMDSMTNFPDDPAALYRWRDEMADLIEEWPSLADMGFEIGSHTWNHADSMDCMDDAAAADEIDRLDRWLDAAGVPAPKVYAYPGGPDRVHPWVNTEPSTLEDFLTFLRGQGYRCIGLGAALREHSLCRARYRKCANDIP